MTKNTLTRSGFILLLTGLTLFWAIIGAAAPYQADPVQAAPPALLAAANHPWLSGPGMQQATPTPASRPPQQRSGVILLNPFAGPSSSPVTVHGQGWRVGNQIVIYLVAEEEEYAVASTMVNQKGGFEVSFFIPAYWKDKQLVTVIARSLDNETSAQAFYNVIDAAPTPVPPPENQDPQGIVTASRLNVRDGPSTGYRVLGQVSQGDQVRITGQNGGWWRINYLHGRGDYGWVAGNFIRTQYTDGVPFIQAPLLTLPTATAVPTPTPRPSMVCDPGQWSGCGGASCQREYVSQCQANGQWGECVWDPGHCSNYENDDENNDDDDDDDNDRWDWYDDDGGVQPPPRPPRP